MAKTLKKERRVPKRIAGLKVPKPLRASAERVLAAMDRKLISDTLAAALVAGAGAIAAGKNRHDAAVAARLGASSAAIRAVEGAPRIGLAAGIAAAELAAGMTRLLAERETPAEPGKGGNKASRPKVRKKKKAR